MSKKISLSEPNFFGNEKKYLNDCIDSGWVSSAGSYVDKFEESIAEYAGVKNAISIKGQTNFKSTAKDILITSQLRTALILNKNTKARNYTLETVNKNIYIFGIAMDSEEKKEVINEANKIYDVEEVIPSIYLATELSRTKF